MTGMAKARRAMALQITVLAGAGATTNIAVAGITTEDEIIACHHTTAGVLVDVTSECSITSDGNIQLATTSTTSDQLILYWNDLSL